MKFGTHQRRMIRFLVRYSRPQADGTNSPQSIGQDQLSQRVAISLLKRDLINIVRYRNNGKIDQVAIPQ